MLHEARPHGITAAVSAALGQLPGPVPERCHACTLAPDPMGRLFLQNVRLNSCCPHMTAVSCTGSSWRGVGGCSSQHSLPPAPLPPFQQHVQLCDQVHICCSPQLAYLAVVSRAVTAVPSPLFTLRQDDFILYASSDLGR